MPNSRKRLPLVILMTLLLAASLDATPAKDKKKKQKAAEDPYAEYVWPPPPDKARMKLERVIAGRSDVVVSSKFKRRLLNAARPEPYDRLKKPQAVAFDGEGRILVTDPTLAALFRFDLGKREMDVFGVRGSVRLQQPMGIGVAADGTIYVADGKLRRVVGFSPEGDVVATIGGEGDLENPTDAAVSPDGTRLFVADAKAHRIVVFDRESGEQVSNFGRRGAGPGQFAFPTSLTFTPEGELFVADQLNARVQVFDLEGEYLDELGVRGTGFGQFERPKDVVVDEVGFIYVTDAMHNNFQIFDADFSLLTFVGSRGRGPGQFTGTSGIDVRGDEIAVVDQLGARLQIFKFIVPKDE